MAPTSTQTPKTPALPFRTRKLRSSSSTNKENGSGSTPLSKVKRTPTKVKQRENSPLKHVSAGTSPGKPTSPVKRVIELQNQISPGPRKSPRKILGELSASASASPSTLSGSPSTPRAKKQLFRRDTSQFSEAKQALSTAVPEVLIGRQKELAVMKRFLQDAWDPKKSGTSKRSLYVSGAPGTGKTACLSYLLKSLEDVKKVFLNCMALKSSKNVFEKIALLLDPSYDGPQAKAQKFIEERLLKSGKGQPILLVLDEIDQLDSKCQEILYTLFEWPHLKGSNLALVGIANALDLTDRILPRLKMSVSISPLQLSFSAYNREEINAIISSRLKSASGDRQEPIIKPLAVKFLAGKISALSGDIRKALDVCRRAIELAEIEYRKQAILAPPTPSMSQSGTPGAIKQIDLPQILKIFNEVYSSRATSSLQESNSDLPLQQKILVATLLLMSNYGPRRCKEVSLGKLHETYSRICKKRSMNGLDVSEAMSLSSLLEARGFFSVKKSKNSVRDYKISLRIDEKEVEAALQDKILLTDIIKDVSCIAK